MVSHWTDSRSTLTLSPDSQKFFAEPRGQKEMQRNIRFVFGKRNLTFRSPEIPMNLLYVLEALALIYLVYPSGLLNFKFSNSSRTYYTAARPFPT